MSLPKELVVIGMPSSVGGADVELYDQIKCWSRMGIKIHLVPTTEPKNCVDLSNLNVVVHNIKDYSICKDQFVISYCNPYFLKDLKIIRSLAKRIFWASCMCYNFKEEIEAAYNGWIDAYLYQSRHQYDKCGGHLLNAAKKGNTIYFVNLIIPYFDRSPFNYQPRKVKPFKIGRISRADPAKFRADQFKIYKEINLWPLLIVGWNDKVANKFKDDLDWINEKVDQGFIKLVPQGGMTTVDFFNSINIFSMASGVTENLPRVAFEALASGCALVLDDNPGWRNIIRWNKTNFNMICDTIDDFSKSANMSWDGYWGSSWLGDLDSPAAILDQYNFKKSSIRWAEIFSYFLT